ncbi:MAG: YggT family protein [Deltaproteobacteria bacterium]|nr:YggT family protein [Deltaproteobacteria bacterium]
MSFLVMLLQSVTQIVHLLINIYSLVLAATVLLSWVNPDPYNPIVRVLRQLTEPLLSQIRRRLPRGWFKTGFDFSPLILLFILIFVDNLLVYLTQMATQSLGGV